MSVGKIISSEVRDDKLHVKLYCPERVQVSLLDAIQGEYTDTLLQGEHGILDCVMDAPKAEVTITSVPSVEKLLYEGDSVKYSDETMTIKSPNCCSLLRLAGTVVTVLGETIRTSQEEASLMDAVDEDLYIEKALKDYPLGRVCRWTGRSLANVSVKDAIPDTICILNVVSVSTDLSTCPYNSPVVCISYQIRRDGKRLAEECKQYFFERPYDETKLFREFIADLEKYDVTHCVDRKFSSDIKRLRTRCPIDPGRLGQVATTSFHFEGFIEKSITEISIIHQVLERGFEPKKEHADECRDFFEEVHKDFKESIEELPL